VDSEVEDLGTELSDHVNFFIEELTLYIKYMDWVCGQNLSGSITKCKQVVDSLQPYIAQIEVGAYGELSCEFIGDIDNADTWLYDDGVGNAPQSRDFTEPTKERLEDLADQTNRVWNPFDAAKDDWLKYLHNMGWAAPTSDVDTYDSDIVDMYNATRQEIDDIWSAVATADQSWANTFGSMLEALTTTVKNFSAAANGFCKLSNYEASTYGQTMAGLGTGEDVFDNAGLYGGDQMTMPSGETATCWDIAMVNTLLERYKDDPSDFEQKFGIPLYAGDDFNFDGIAELYYDWIKQNHPDDLTAGQNGALGLYMSCYSSCWTEFCADHGVKADVTPHITPVPGHPNEVYTDQMMTDVTPQNWVKKAKGGTIEVNVNWVDLIDPSTGQHVIPKQNGAHAMDITGVTDNGYFIVSSWGKEYYLDPSNGSIYDFMKITYE
jgi:hypothetical protein